MKTLRKTNLFKEYDNSKLNDTTNLTEKSFFLPFSTYTESLTGSHLSMDAKLFPSAFICFYIKEFDKTAYPSSKPILNINNFIRRFVRLFENKLAFLNDYVNDDENEHTKDELEPLAYLIHYIEKVFSVTNGEVVYVGKIAEQDYDGVYSDMMLTIEAGNTPLKYEISKKEGADKTWKGAQAIIKEYDSFYQDEKLYGWYYKKDDNTVVYTGPSNYSDLTPGADINNDKPIGEHSYVMDVSSCYTAIKSRQYTDEEKANGDDKEMRFNFVVPLYDTFIDDATSSNNGTQNKYQIDDSIPTGTDTKTVINLADLGCNGKKQLNSVLIPLGVWWSGYTPVVLNRSNDENPSWTLTLSSQFKPFPYTSNINPTSSNTSDSSTKSAIHNTFAQILSRQNNAIDKIMEQNKTIANLRSEIEAIKVKL